MHAEDSDRFSLSFCRLLVLIRALRHGMGTKILLGLVPVIGSVMVELLIESLRVYPLTKRNVAIRSALRLLDIYCIFPHS